MPTRATLEPPHIHVEQGGMEAKFWLTPDAALSYNDGFDARVLRRLTEIVEDERDKFLRAWDGFFD